MHDTYWPPIPRVGVFDDSLAFWREGYTYLSSRCDALSSDVFRTRLLLKPVVCARGAEAAKTFYGTDAFTRTGAMPKSAQHLLQDERSVQDLDGESHSGRKQLFLRLLEKDATSSFVADLNAVWRQRADRWRSGDRVELYAALNTVLTETALRWMGLPATAREVRLRCDEMSAMIDHAASIGPANWWARLLRRRSEAWAASVIEDIRSGELESDADGMARVIAVHTENGERLPASVAAVELLNVVRPIVAIARFAVFAAVALWTFPDWRDRIRRGDDAQLHAFVQEVRRYYPFFPVIGGRAKRDLELVGHALPADTWVLLDLYGTNHDRRIWTDPHSFRPERFENAEPGPYALIPQGGGDYASGHRCPGESITVAATAELVRILCGEQYALPAQDLTIDLSRMPALPRSGVVLERL